MLNPLPLAPSISWPTWNPPGSQPYLAQARPWKPLPLPPCRSSPQGGLPGLTQHPVQLQLPPMRSMQPRQSPVAPRV